ncbi:UNVERIFIED_ORG: putative nucleotide-binding protein [Herbaspirillum seropedicae]
MATKKTTTPVQQAKLSQEQMRKAIPRLKRLIEDIKAFDTSSLTERFGSAQGALETQIEGTLSSIFGHDTVEYRRYADATRLDNGSIYMSVDYVDDGPRARKNVNEGKINACGLLETAIKWLEEEIADANEPLSAQGSSASLSNRIFVVHGHDDGARETVARFIDRIGLEAIILAEQANQGRTIIEKIEANSGVGFAVVLLTPDDVGGKSVDSLRHRARQNVLLELGYFMGRLGRNRVCALAKGDIEIPTDFAGVVWTGLDEAGAWKAALAKELDAVGYAVDWNKVMRS